MKVLVTGGTGYIGSHTCVELLNNGYEVVIVDNLVNSNSDVLIRIKEITGKVPSFYHIDLRDSKSMKKVFKENRFDAVIHFASLKSVTESVLEPLIYYDNNLNSIINLLKFTYNYNIKNIIFSSSAAVYGSPDELPITEDAQLKPVNPYGRTKLFVEEILKDYQGINSDSSVTILRYFNPIGAHPSGLIGEMPPTEAPNNLVPYIAKVASGELKYLYAYGNDYDTIDGTGVRDYIHVCDLAQGHILALNNKFNNPGVHIYNLGTGQGYSVLQVIETFSEVAKLRIPYVITNRRPGDIACCYADCTKANKELGFKAKYDLKDMCRDAWNWQNKLIRGN